MTELSFNQQKKLVDIVISTANKLANWSFLEIAKVDDEFMKHFEFMLKETLIGVFHYKYGREVEITLRNEEIKTTKADVVEVVRCKDCCKYSGKYCLLTDDTEDRREPDDFCSYGERKEE